MTTASSLPITPARAILGDIKIAHSVFALPFALLAATMAARPGIEGLEIRGTTLGWAIGLIVAAMVAARTAAMLTNRIFDRHIDARNPRTARRPLAAGAVPLRVYVQGLVCSVLIFEIACLLFWTVNDNPWPLILSLPVLAWICAYGLFKRFTMWCHLWLGASLALSAPAAAVAMNPAALTHLPALWLIAGMVLCWVAGFDVIYALQDIDVDVAERLHSMPSRLGLDHALWCSRILHTTAIGLLLWAWAIDPAFGGLFLGAVILAAVVLVFEHLTVRRWGTTRMALTFFTLNGIVSCVLGAAGIADVLA